MKTPELGHKRRIIFDEIRKLAKRYPYSLFAFTYPNILLNMTKREQALAFVVGEVAAGTEFPDAEAMAFSRFGVPTAQIREDYDHYCSKRKEAYDDLCHRAFNRMLNEGGGFAHYLAKAYFVADSGNKKRIQDGWPHLIERYGA